MKTRTLGKTGAEVSELIFGCGKAGGIMIHADPETQLEAVKKALDAGINWFDTAAGYGDGKSEENLGRCLKELDAKPFISTKLRIDTDNLADIPGQIERKTHKSLERLQVESIDLLQLHNGIEGIDGHGHLCTDNVLGRVGAIVGMEKVRDEGLTKWIGMTALGDTGLVKRIIESARMDTAQIYFNMINPTAAHAMPQHSSSQEKDKPSAGQDFTGVLNSCVERDVGIIVIRSLAAGVLATDQRHDRESILTKDTDIKEEERKAKAVFDLISDNQGSRAQTALRFALSHPAVTCVHFAVSDLDQLMEGVAATEMGPLPGDILQILDKFCENNYLPI